MASNDAYLVLQGAGVYFQMMQMIMDITVHPFWGFSFHICFFLFYFFFVRYPKIF